MLLPAPTIFAPTPSRKPASDDQFRTSRRTGGDVDPRPFYKHRGEYPHLQAREDIERERVRTPRHENGYETYDFIRESP